jgi:cysteine-rich repeat protein
LVAGTETCDDGNKLGGDGCNARCAVESGYVCPAKGGKCVLTTCGDSILGGTEQCDDGNLGNSDGCSSTCKVETSCGDGIVGGTEACDDKNTTPGDGCSATCQWEAGKACTGPAGAVYSCSATTCGDGKRGNLEACDDNNQTSGDGCSATCTVESFYACSGAVGAKSSCKKQLEFVAVRAFNVSFIQPESLLYDPRTRSFVGYKTANTQVPIELCLDGTEIIHPISSSQGICPPGYDPGSPQCTTTVPDEIVRTRPLAISISGATYDPVAGSWLLLDSNNTLRRVTNVQTTTPTPAGVILGGVSGGGNGIAVGDDGRLYVAATSGSKVYAFARNNSAIGFDLAAPVSSFSIDVSTGGQKLDDLFNLAGFGYLGTFTDLTMEFWLGTSTGTPQTPAATSTLPGVLFSDKMANGTAFTSSMFDSYLGAAETTTDGSGFVMCSNNPSNSCFLFAQTCKDDSDCASGASCQKFDDLNGNGVQDGGEPSVAVPYCSAKAKARDDYTSANAGSSKVVPVLDNDTRSEGTCADTTVEVIDVSETTRRSAAPHRRASCTRRLPENATLSTASTTLPCSAAEIRTRRRCSSP